MLTSRRQLHDSASLCVVRLNRPLESKRLAYFSDDAPWSMKQHVLSDCSKCCVNLTSPKQDTNYLKAILPHRAAHQQTLGVNSAHDHIESNQEAIWLVHGDGRRENRNRLMRRKEPLKSPSPATSRPSDERTGIIHQSLWPSATWLLTFSMGTHRPGAIWPINQPHLFYCTAHLSEKQNQESKWFISV